MAYYKALRFTAFNQAKPHRLIKCWIIEVKATGPDCRASGPGQAGGEGHMGTGATAEPIKG